MYSKTTWVTGGAPGISAAYLNKIEQGIAEAHWFATTTNSANAYSATLNPAPTSYVSGMTVRLQINAASSGAVTINLNGLGAKSVKSSQGAAVSNWRLNAVVTLVYNGTDFISQGEGSDGDAVPGDVWTGKKFDNINGPQVGTLSIASGDLRAGVTFHGVAGDAWVVWTGDADNNDGAVLNGYRYWAYGAKRTGTMPNRGAPTWTVSTGAQGLAAGYYTGGTINGEPNIAAGNIRNGVVIAGVTGNLNEFRSAGGVNGVDGTNCLTVGGLSFEPRIIMVLTPNATNPYNGSMFLWYANGWTNGNYTLNGQSQNVGQSGGYVVWGGFKLYTGWGPGNNMEWKAWGI